MTWLSNRTKLRQAQIETDSNTVESVLEDVDEQAATSETEIESIVESESPSSTIDENLLSIEQQLNDSVSVTDQQNVDRADQLKTLKAQADQLGEGLAAGEIEGESFNAALQDIQSQLTRLSTLVEIEDTNLATAQNRIVEAAEAEPDADLVNGEGDGLLSPKEIEASLSALEIDTNDETQVSDLTIEEDGQFSTEASQLELDAEEPIVNIDTNNAVAGVVDSIGEALDDAKETVVEGASNLVDEASLVFDPSEAGDELATVIEPEAQVDDALFSSSEENAGAITPASDSNRVISETSLLDNVKGLLGAIPEFGLKVGAGVIALLGVLFLWMRRRSREEFDASMLDIETEEVSMNSEASIQRMSDASGIDLAVQMIVHLSLPSVGECLFSVKRALAALMTKKIRC